MINIRISDDGGKDNVVHVTLEDVKGVKLAISISELIEELMEETGADFESVIELIRKLNYTNQEEPSRLSIIKGGKE